MIASGLYLGQKSKSSTQSIKEVHWKNRNLNICICAILVQYFCNVFANTIIHCVFLSFLLCRLLIHSFTVQNFYFKGKMSLTKNIFLDRSVFAVPKCFISPHVFLWRCQNCPLLHYTTFFWCVSLNNCGVSSFINSYPKFDTWQHISLLLCIVFGTKCIC